MKRKFKKITFAMLLLTISFSGISCSKDKTAEKAVLPPEHAKIIEEYKKGVEESKKIVVARVNGVDIMLKELIDRMNQVGSKFIAVRQQRTPELDTKVRKEALDTLVLRELAFQDAIRKGMKVDPGAVDATINKLKTELGSDNAYKEYLEKSDLTEGSFRKQIEKDKLIEMITSKEIIQKVKVDEKLVRDTYKKEKESFVEPENFMVEDVFFQIVKDEAASMNKAKEVLSLIKKDNNDISKIAQDKTLLVRNGGITKQEYPNIFQAASQMKAGDLSNVIKESDGLHIIKMIRKEPLRQLSFEEARVDIENKLMGPRMNKRKEQWESELKKNAKIEIMESAYVRSETANKGRN